MNTMPFKPAWLFRNPHFQTIWPALFRHIQKPPYIRERIELLDGDFIDIDWCGDEQYGAPIAILLHGLEGSSNSPYIRGLARKLSQQGWRCAAVNFRGCSGELNRLQRSYHSGATDDLEEIITFLRKRHPDSPLHAIGFSLGGNVLLKWCAETGVNNPLDAAIAVSVPYQLAVAGRTLDGKGFFSRLYRWRLLSSLKKKALQKMQQGILAKDIADIKQIQSFYDFDDRLTAPLHGYKDADDYYSRASSHPHLDKIQIPTLLLHAMDDPFMNSGVITEQSKMSADVSLELSQNGGHVGFYQPSINNNSYWLETRITDFLKSRTGKKEEKRKEQR
jgi:predicted alpha/beta-fold hydrolase